MKQISSAQLLSSIVLVCIIISVASATIIPVEDIQLGFAAATFYNAAGDYFNLNNASTVSGLLRVKGAATYDYTISGKVTISNCNLVNDLSASGRVKGNFAGGATMTVTGTLKDSLGNTYINNDTILVATMIPTSAQTWALDMVGYPLTNMSGSVEFNPTNGGLNSGVVIGGGNVLQIGDFRADFAFQNVKALGSTPTSLLGTNYNILGMPASVQLTAIPEPASMLLLALGGLGIIGRKK